MSKSYIVFPRDGLGPRISDFSAEPTQLSMASADVARRTLSTANMAYDRILTNSGAVDSDGRIVDDTSKAAEDARREGVPRVLEALDALIVDDPSDEQLAALRDQGEVVENREIPLMEPVEESSDSAEQRWHLDKIKVDSAWSKGLNGDGVRIGILDTGIDASHPDFVGKSVSFAEYDKNGFLISTAPRDAGSHGTHVSGLAAGATYGVAPKADLAVAAALTTVTPRGMVGYLAQILAGFNWLAHTNHDSGGISQCPVINASLGGQGYDAYLYSSVETIRRVPSSLLVAAIGNSGRRGVDNHGSPGNYDNVVGVGATDSSDISADFSDWGFEATNGAVKPNMSAPGVDVWSAVPGGGFARMSGTSMASPLVAGAAALLVQQTPALGRNSAGLQTRLMQLVDTAPAANPVNTVSGRNKIGSGRLDLSTI